MSVSKIFNLTRNLTLFPRSISSFFKNSQNNHENEFRASNFGKSRRYSTEENEGFLKSLKNYSKRVKFYDRSEPEEELTAR